MTRQTACLVNAVLLFFTFVGTANAADDFLYRFLGSPLLILVVLLVIDALALIYHKIRR